MTGHPFTLCGTALVATATGALWIAATRTLCVSDLHLGKSDRIARRSGMMLPPYETDDTLTRLGHDIAHHAPQTVVCLGDSFDDMTAAQNIAPDAAQKITALQGQCDWIWIEGNHDPSPANIAGHHSGGIVIAGLDFRHIATGLRGQVSGHYHPKHAIKGAGPARSCFLYDATHLVLPAYGTYTGGLAAQSPVLSRLFPKGAIAVLTGKTAIPVPVAP